ncbi:pectin lyase fold/virulence factor [Fusarium redolens]|uniref:Pectin lyase fold/virulence factor n=1 Tax=Fusarium redolens TaxID=48865 RepID=A0A9P9KJG7_FUSRE|nr:pectin lyase fold/virulence factor [Fusarium redolens]KAH7259410.1 pectin lyase fold/virulence factor [Fusarium redolens]
MLLFKYILAVLPAALAKDIFVSPNGSSSGSGSSSSPLADIQAAVNAASAGDTIYLRKGTYSPSKNIHFTKKGSSSKPYTISSYNNEEVIIDGDKMSGTPAALGASLAGKDRGIFHVEKAEYWRFIHITLTKGPYGVYVKDSHNNYFERLTTHSNYETGFHMQNSISNNEIVYLDTYNNADPRNNGQNADGMAIKEGSGAGNIIRGIRSYENADDGIDLYEFKSSVTILDNIIFDNGVNRWNFNPYRGDGIGIKLGGGSPANRANVNHVARNNFSFRNRRGFSDNNMPGDMTLVHNTAWKNREEGFNQRSSKATYENNLSANNAGSSSLSKQNTLTSVKGKGNNWEKGGSWQDADFKATSTSLVKGRRQANGKITRSDFLRPADGGNYGATTHWV